MKKQYNSKPHRTINKCPALTKDLFTQHIATLVINYEAALSNCIEKGGGLRALLVHSGCEGHYYGDDRGIAFQSFGHLIHWLPVNRPDQFVYFRSGEQPIYFQIVPEDYWYDQGIVNNSWWADCFRIIRLSTAQEIAKHLPKNIIGQLGYLGPNESLATDLGIKTEWLNPQTVIRYLDFQRAYKTAYEVEQLKAANRLALTGHNAARQKFLDGGNEYEIHMAYLQACTLLEDESPYTNIVALDEKAAILHYQHKRRIPADGSKVLLIDAGYRVNGYGSDITRTSVKPSVHKAFKALLTGIERIEEQLVAMVKPGVNYPDIHLAALAQIAQLLIDLEICRGSLLDLIELKIPHLFMPHGVGHLLGIQVHDVGGHQQDIAGSIQTPPTDISTLRNTRQLDVNMVFTIEPGCYFIPLLLEPVRSESRSKFINWKLVEELYCCGGIRVEDNVLVTNDGVENLTRQFE